MQISELAERLKGISRAQEALQELFASVLGREPSLEIVLRQIVAAARELTNARYGALGVFDRERREFVEFVTEGLENDEEAAAAVSSGIRALRAAGPPDGRSRPPVREYRY